MHQNVNLYTFREAFRQSNRTNFSYEGLGLLFEHFEAWEDGGGQPREGRQSLGDLRRSADECLDATDRLLGPVAVVDARRGADRLGDGRIGHGDQDRPEIGLHGPAPDMDDHRLARDISKRFAREAG